MFDSDYAPPDPNDNSYVAWQTYGIMDGHKNFISTTNNLLLVILVCPPFTLVGK